jgi:hypothetical protein
VKEFVVEEIETDVRKRILKQEIDECMRALDQSQPVVILAKRSDQLMSQKKMADPALIKTSGRSSTMGNILTRINQHELRVEGIMIDCDNVLVQAPKSKTGAAQSLN